MQSTLAESTINEAVLQAPVAHILYGCAIHRIIYYPADKYYALCIRRVVDLSNGSCYPPFE